MAYTHRQQIEAYVDEGIRSGRVQQAMREQYINLLASDPGAAEHFATGMMRGVDYTNKNKERAEAERQAAAALEAERSRLNSERVRLSQWEQSAQAEINRLRAVEGESARYHAAIAQYKQVLADYKIPETDPLKDWQPGQPPRPTQPAYQPPAQPAAPTQDPRYVTQDGAMESLRNVVLLQGQLNSISGQHQALFGQPLTDDLIAEAMSANMLNDLPGYWRNKYNVAGKQAEVEAQRATADRARMEAEIRAQVMSELSANPSAIVGQNGLYQPEPSPLAGYMNSRATQHNPVAPPNQGQVMQAQATVPDDARRPPEKVGHIESRRASVEGATNYFRKHYNVDGTPINRGGGPAQ